MPYRTTLRLQIIGILVYILLAAFGILLNLGRSEMALYVVNVDANIADVETYCRGLWQGLLIALMSTLLAAISFFHATILAKSLNYFLIKRKLSKKIQWSVDCNHLKLFLVLVSRSNRHY